MREGGYTPNNDSWFKRALVTAGIISALEGGGMHDAPKKQAAPATSVERSPTKVENSKPLLPDSKPNLDGDLEENWEDAIEAGSEPQEDSEADKAQVETEKLESNLSDFIINNYKGYLTEVSVDGSDYHTVLIAEELPNADIKDRTVIKYRFDESGNCYLSEIAGDENVRFIEQGKDQEEIVRSIIDSAVEFKKGASDRIEEYLAQGKSIDSIIKEKLASWSELYDLWLKYSTEDRKAPDGYEERLQEFFLK